MPGRNTRMQQWINYRVRVTIQDDRMLVGTFLAFDRHMNIVLCDCEEYRRTKIKGSEEEKEIKRPLGFIMLRGENIVSLTAEAPPPSDKKRAGEGPTAGPGRGFPAGRGVPVAPLGAAPIGLAAPVRGIGGPGAPQMVPQGIGAAPSVPMMPRPPGGVPRPQYMRMPPVSGPGP